MKILIDQNISQRLCALISDFGEVFHVKDLSLLNKPDILIWKHAKKENFVIITHDADFNDLAELYGHPPKIIWIVEGNLTTKQIGEKLRKNKAFIKEFVSSDDRSVFYL